MLSVEAQLADDLSQFYADPLGYVMFNFPWDTDTAIQIVDWDDEEINVMTGKSLKEVMAPYRKRFNCQFGPDLWACEFLDDWGEEIKKRGFDGTKAVPPIRFCTTSGHGIGKSTLSAWIIKFILDTRPFSRGTVTANTETQLRTRTWAELGKWHRRSLTRHWFDYSSGKGSMSLKHHKHKDEWFCSAQTCREENSEAFAGQHAANSTSFYLFDEASGIPDSIYGVRDGGTTDGESMTFDFGNPTRNSGRFHKQCVGKLKHRYIVRSIDSRSVHITGKQHLREFIEDYGVESDRVKVRVRGLFPSQGSCQFMPTSWVKRAMLRENVYNPRGTLTIGVDVARFGDDDSVIYPVIDNDARSFAPTREEGVYHGLDNVELALKAIEKVEFFRSMGVECAGLFVDVGGTGSGVVDTLVHAGYNPIPINFGNSAVYQPETYRYRGDEMWGRAKEKIKTDLILPVLPEFKLERDGGFSEDVASKILEQLTQREYGFTIQGNKIHLETKKEMKKRGLDSPDIADALVLNFAQDVAPSKVLHGTPVTGKMSEHDFNPMDHVTVN